MDEQLKVQIQFTITDDDGVQFTDALYLNPGEWEAMTQEQKDAAKQERFDAWKASIQVAQEAPQIDPIEAAANKAIEIEDLQRQQAEIIEQASEQQQLPVEEIIEQIEQKKEELSNPDPTPEQTQTEGV